MEISERDFNRAIELANKAGQDGYAVSVDYIPPQTATQDSGQFVVNRFRLTAAGDRA